MHGGEHKVAREGRLDGDLGGLQVADLSDQDDVGVLAYDGSQSVGEGQSDGGLHLDLVDPD